ncbi:TPA: beta-ketoacyl-[acyl-carrier-protein] synthase family protein [Enterobacter roggenkampii]|nr:beta-ketoacyl-[acyl-carrier-protein] synthase family protein [Enterobacter roggenkampii]
MIYISAVGMVNALGNSHDEIAANLVTGLAPGMHARTGWLQGSPDAVLGGVEGELPPIPETLSAHRTRNNQLLLAALAQIQSTVDEAIARVGRDRVAVVLGTSTSGLDEGDEHVQRMTHGEASTHWQYPQQELGDPSRFLANWLQLEGPAYTISTACSSSARAMIGGKRLIEAGLVDIAIVGGADTLSRMPVNGFNSLESFSPTLCEPFGRDRRGITIGEAAGAITQALNEAGMQPGDIGYINLHGTATPLNDQIESQVVHDLFGESVPCSSTKHLTGHTLGAAGITEAALSWLILTRDLPLPPQDFARYAPDDTLAPCGLLHQRTALTKPVILSNSFAFGGNNASILLGRAS